MAKVPSSIIYPPDASPPGVPLALLALQHVLVMSSTLFVPILIVGNIGGSIGTVRSVVAMAMIAAGIGTALQAIKRGPVGSGYLCPNLCGPSYFAVSMKAAWLGGLPLMHGMIILSGLFEIVFSRFLPRLRALFPTEITGLVVLLVAFALVPVGASKFVGIEYAGDPVRLPHLLASAATLLLMIGLNLWGSARLKMYSVLAGIIFGYLASSVMGLIGDNAWQQVADAPWFALPWREAHLFSYSFDLSLLPAFLIVSLCASLKSMGNIITCQRINDVEWNEPDLKNAGKGLTADGIAVLMGGMLGGVAVDTSASNVGLSAATGATSRKIGLVAGCIYIALAFMPKLTSIIAIMPDPLVGAIVLYVTCFMFAAGLKIISSQPMDTQRTFVIGLALGLGLSVDFMPELYATVPEQLAPFFSSSLTLGTVLALVLNQLFGLKKKK